MPTNIRTSWHLDKNKVFYPTRSTNLLNVELSKIDNWDNIFRFNSIFDLLKAEINLLYFRPNNFDTEFIRIIQRRLKIRFFCFRPI